MVATLMNAWWASSSCVTEQVTYRVESVVTGLTRPWGIAFLPNGSALVTEMAGRLRLIDGCSAVPGSIDGLPRVVTLLDVEVDPDFARTGWIFLSYVGSAPNGVGTEVLRGQLVNGRLEDPEVIFAATPKSPRFVHFGGRLQFLDDGTLLISLGARDHAPDDAQELANHSGSIVRINTDGTAPSDNPFVNRPGARPEVFSYGHRNVQGLAIHPETREIWSSEHGPIGGDEVNVIKPGANYGWPVVTYGKQKSDIDYGTQDNSFFEPPISVWTPAIAPSGIVFYTGAAFPDWENNLFVAALAGRHLRRLEVENHRVAEQQVLLPEINETIRDVAVGPNGALYVLTDSLRGRVLKIGPTGKDPICAFAAP